ncbi:hypothetical protein BDV98DRAFT_584088 [Pterulicium gracile]|uniref:Uncharacterized protein n=1 Tax=Pterulicium gracile TaxID=1884261 RepID=A0A5C3QN17_9AGAR|nr:hypothetical protein BDV98DRAFT_584088 [Pterula gracilis]
MVALTDRCAAQTCAQEVSAKNTKKQEHNMVCSTANCGSDTKEKDKPVHREVACNAKACDSVNRSPVKCRDNCRRKGIHVDNTGVVTGPKVQRLVKSNRTLTGYARSKSEVFADDPYNFRYFWREYWQEAGECGKLQHNLEQRLNRYRDKQRSRILVVGWSQLHAANPKDQVRLEQRERSMKGKDKLSKDEKTGASPQKRAEIKAKLCKGAI